MPKNLASFNDERKLMPRAVRNKLSVSKKTSFNSLNAKKYDATDDDNSEEGVEITYGMNIHRRKKRKKKDE